MNTGGIDIERVVSEVLRRLGKHETRIAKGSEHEGTTGICAERVLTLATIAGWPGETQEVTLEPGCVVTPAAKDELRARNIRIRRASEPKPTAPCGSYAAVVQCDGSRVARILSAVDAAAEVVEFETVEQALEQIAPIAEAGDLATLWTTSPTKAICSANRNPNVWAVQGWDLSSIKHAVAQVDANLLIVDSRQTNDHLTRAMLKVFLSQK